MADKASSQDSPTSSDKRILHTELLQCHACGRYLAAPKFSPDQIGPPELAVSGWTRMCQVCEKDDKERKELLKKRQRESLKNAPKGGFPNGKQAKYAARNGFHNPNRVVDGVRMHWCCMCEKSLPQEKFSIRQRKAVRAGEKKCIPCAQQYHHDCTLTRTEIARRTLQQEQLAGLPKDESSASKVDKPSSESADEQSRSPQIQEEFSAAEPQRFYERPQHHLGGDDRFSVHRRGPPPHHPHHVAGGGDHWRGGPPQPFHRPQVDYRMDPRHDQWRDPNHPSEEWPPRDGGRIVRDARKRVRDDRPFDPSLADERHLKRPYFPTSHQHPSNASHPPNSQPPSWHQDRFYAAPVGAGYHPSNFPPHGVPPQPHRLPNRNDDLYSRSGLSNQPRADYDLSRSVYYQQPQQPHQPEHLSLPGPVPLQPTQPPQQLGLAAPATSSTPFNKSINLIQQLSSSLLSRNSQDPINTQTIVDALSALTQELSGAS